MPQAAAAVIKNLQDRTEAIRTIFESVGGRLEHYYIVFSEHTIYLLGEIPDQESLAAIMMSICASGYKTIGPGVNGAYKYINSLGHI